MLDSNWRGFNLLNPSFYLNFLFVYSSWFVKKNKKKAFLTFCTDTLNSDLRLLFNFFTFNFVWICSKFTVEFQLLLSLGNDCIFPVKLQTFSNSLHLSHQHWAHHHHDHHHDRVSSWSSSWSSSWLSSSLWKNDVRAPQKIQNLFEPPRTAHMVAKFYINNLTVRTEK